MRARWPADRRCARAIAVAVSVALGLAMASQGAAADEPPRRSAYPGFSVLAPPGPDWVRVRSDSRSLVWMRRQRDPAHSFSVAVLTGPVPEGLDAPKDFETWVQTNKSASPDPERFVVRSVSVTRAEGHQKACLAYRTQAEDRSGGASSLLVVAGLACRHPDAPGRYFDVQHAERRPANLAADSPEEEGEAFVEGFRFEAAPADRNWRIAPERAVDPAREAS